MKGEFSTEYSWQKVDRFDDHVDMDMSIGLEDFIDNPQQIEREIDENQDAFRARIFIWVIENVIPIIMNDVGVLPVIPSGLKTNCHIRSESSHSSLISTERSFVQSQMRIVMDLTSSKSVPTLIAFYNARGGLASRIADDVVHHLRNIYLGATESNSNMKARFIGDKVADVNFNHEEREAA